MDIQAEGRLARYAIWASVLLVFVWFGVWAVQGPGLQYDEALSVSGALLLVTPAASLPCQPDGIMLGHHCWPLMVAPYVGAIKDYIAAPIFWLLGPRVAAARLVAVLLLVTCILGLSRFLSRRVSPVVGAVTALCLSIHPAFLDLAMFDNGNIAVSLALLGVAAVVLDEAAESQRPGWMFTLGVLVGIMAWARLNLLWLLVSTLIALILVFRASIVPSKASVAALAGGALLGSAPMLVYHYFNPTALRAFLASIPGSAEAQYMTSWYRLRMLLEVFLSDSEHRMIWARTYHPDWRLGASLVLVAVALGWCIVRRKPAPDGSVPIMRCFALTIVGLIALMFASRQVIAEHHMVILVPLAVPCVVVLLHDMMKQKAMAAAAVCISVLYAATASGIDIYSAVQIHKTKGTSEWSSAIYPTYALLRNQYGNQDVKILDWGLEAQLSFLSRARWSPPEIFWSADETHSAPGRSWSDEIRGGGVFVTTGAANRAFKAPTEGFQEALQSGRFPYSLTRITEKDGEPFALVYTIQRE